MLVNLSDVLTSEGRQAAREVPLEMDCFENGMGHFEMISKSPVSITFTNVGPDKAKIEGSVRLKFKTSCDRCLAEVPITLELDFERFVSSPGVGAEEEEADDADFMDGYDLDVDALVRSEIVVNWPTKILCRNDCRGLCLICGQNLNIGECGCDTFIPDPRMAVIQDIFNANKEV